MNQSEIQMCAFYIYAIVCINYRTDSTSWYPMGYICFRRAVTDKAYFDEKKNLPKLALKPQKLYLKCVYRNKTMGHIALPLLCGLVCDYKPIMETLQCGLVFIYKVLNSN